MLAIFFYLLSCVTVSAIAYDNIIVRPAQPGDLGRILELDRRVTCDFFRSLYLNNYQQFEFGKNPDIFLELELKSDEETFLSFIEECGSERILIAVNGSSIIAGFVLFHVNADSIMHIDLLMVDKDFRRMGAGRKLITAMLNSRPDVATCVVCPLKFGNESTLSFYESLGFVNLGPASYDEMSFYGVPRGEIQWYYKLTK